MLYLLQGLMMHPEQQWERLTMKAPSKGGPYMVVQ
jgi:hypothetical protein